MASQHAQSSLGVEAVAVKGTSPALPGTSEVTPRVGKLDKIKAQPWFQGTQRT